MVDGLASNPDASRGVPSADRRVGRPNRHRGLKVFLPFPGKTLFENLGHLDLDLRHDFPPQDLEAGLIVISFPHSSHSRRVPGAFAALKRSWSDALSLTARERRIRIILDVSTEGHPAVSNRLDPVHQGLAELGVRPESAIVVTQDRNYATDYHAYLRARGLKSGLKVLCYDYWIRCFHEKLRRRGPDLLARRLAAFANRPESRGRRFVSLNMSLRPSKVLFLLSLIRDGLWDEGHVSCGGFVRKRGSIARERVSAISADKIWEQIEDLGHFHTLAKELMPYFPQLEAKGQIILGNVRRDPDTGLPRRTPLGSWLSHYQDAWFTAVT